MNQYKKLIQDILDNGSETVRDQPRLTRAKLDGEPALCRSVFGRMMRFDLSNGLPVVTLKKTNWKKAIHELLWFISGETSLQPLEDAGVKFWEPWKNQYGGVGRLYPSQWRNAGATNSMSLVISEIGAAFLDDHFDEDEIECFSEYFEDDGLDQLGECIRLLKQDPASRRMLVDCWQVRDLPFMVLAPCHFAYQFWVDNKKLSLWTMQRSCDAFLGLPFNLVCYSTLIHMVAQVCDLEPGELVWTGGDIHLYENQIEPAKAMLGRKCLPLPNLSLNSSIKDIDDFKIEHFELENYLCHPPLRVKPAV